MRHFVRFAALVVVMFLGTTFAFAQEKSDLQAAIESLTQETVTEQPRLKLSAQSTLLSKYIGALGHSLSEKAVMQETLSASYGGWEWKSVGFEGTARSDVTADEVDLWLSYKHKVGTWSLGGGGAYFAFDPVLDHKGDVAMPFVQASRDFAWFPDHTLNFCAKVEDRIGKFPDHLHRFNPSVTLRDTWQVRPGVRIVAQASCLYDRGVDQFSRGWLPQASLGLAVDLSENVTAEASLRLVRPVGFHDQMREYGHDEVFSISLTIRF